MTPESTSPPEAEPDPAKEAAAEAEIARQRILTRQQARAGAFLGLLPVQVVAFTPLWIEGVEGAPIVDITVRVDTRSFEWQRTAALRVVKQG